MDLKEEFEARINRLERFIEDKGLGHRQLEKAKKVQRSLNAIAFLGGLITIAGVVIWSVSNKD
ncbi:hypothetical protein [Geofilum rubicundum]|uniref:Uncharacterized protein n=1 Tax=Geofilum rubicundum JCM 15548 TaxID=1236989 RepID=A0A0E9M403_9BACT|nr:hypothetical protein [Geofilum rubicundum]GAO31900.1 hypothetical protein JCM15548_14312 [Geofilum rubicundum JCM 15548]